MPPAWHSRAGAGIGAAEIGDAARCLHRHENATKRLRIRSLVGRIAKVDGAHRGRRSPSRPTCLHRRFHDVLDVAHRETVARDPPRFGTISMYSRPVCRSANVLRVPGTWRSKPSSDTLTALDLLQILAEDFDPDRRADTRGQHVDALRIGGAMAIW